MRWVRIKSDGPITREEALERCKRKVFNRDTQIGITYRVEDGTAYCEFFILSPEELSQLRFK